ncbi:hypothetical protein KPL39_07825 [Clostridium gasigenes]|uniref:hypothetical protein n=1 Tax=Clostridium gasigenes TaxID=94869 RepID=UPI001C0BA987|nr:hypothetical protein [Clostridium gasigenes]MBU3136177.1 hypothetical protein [Clostridium gasigenes]
MNDKIKTLIDRHINSKEKGIVAWWDVITKVFSYISILEIIIQIYKYRVGYYSQENKEELKSKMDKLYKFIEVWVVTHSILAPVISLVLFYYFDGKEKKLIYTILIYGLFRVFEIIIKQIRVILFDTIGVNAIDLKGARRSIILLIHNIVEMISWFAISFMGIILLDKSVVGKSFEKLSEVYSWFDFILCSTLQMTVFSDGYTSIKDIMTKQNFLATITIIEIIMGFIIIVVALARFFSLLPGVGQIDDDKNDSNPLHP